MLQTSLSKHSGPDAMLLPYNLVFLNAFRIYFLEIRDVVSSSHAHKASSLHITTVGTVVSVVTILLAIQKLI